MDMKKNYPYKFSVVVAVYNVENYLAEAIDSLLGQDIGFQESVQLILVDDGSPDNSGQICDEYQAKYPSNIKVIHKTNGGVSSARNEGLKHVEGRYINFMDSDDKISPNTLSAVYDYFSTVDDQVDLVSIPLYFFESKEGGHRLNYKFDDKKNQIIDLEDKYWYVQMSGASAFFKNEVLISRNFDTSLKYSEGSKGYLSMIGGLSNDPKRAKELADNITKTVAGDPSIKAVKSLVSDVAEAKQITDEFSLNPEIENFLKKVSSQRATVFDLSPNILTWLNEKNLTSKLKIRF